MRCGAESSPQARLKVARSGTHIGTVSAGAAGRVCPPGAARGVPVLVMDVQSAELVKVSANAFLAARLSFINVLAEVCNARCVLDEQRWRSAGWSFRVLGRP